MPADNLLRPDNRLLGSSTGDVSLYGGQPDPAVNLLRDGDAVQPQPGAQPATAPTPAAATPDASPAPATSPADASPVDTPTIQAGSTSSAAPAPSDPVPHALDDPIPVTALAGGTTALGLIGQPTIADPAHPDGSGPTDLLGAQTFTQAIGTAPVLSQLDGSLASVTAQVAQAEALIHGATDAVGGVADDALAAVTTVQAGLTDTLADVGHVVDTIAPTLDIDQLVFGGSDPGGGITTLVGLVQSSELFAVGAVDSAPAAPDASGSIVDDLIGDATTLVAPLIGDHGDHHTDDLGALHLGI